MRAAAGSSSFVIMFSPATEPASDLWRVLGWTTIGNAAGGVLFAALIRWSVLIRGSGEPGRR